MSASADKPTPQANEFAQHGTMKRASFVGEYFYFLKTRKKWWMLPLLVLLLGFGLLMILSSSAAAPFIYTLF